MIHTKLIFFAKSIFKKQTIWMTGSAKVDRSKTYLEITILCKAWLILALLLGCNSSQEKIEILSLYDSVRSPDSEYNIIAWFGLWFEKNHRMHLKPYNALGPIECTWTYRLEYEERSLYRFHSQMRFSLFHSQFFYWKSSQPYVKVTLTVISSNP